MLFYDYSKHHLRLWAGVYCAETQGKHIPLSNDQQVPSVWKGPVEGPAPAPSRTTYIRLLRAVFREYLKELHGLVPVLG